MSDNSYTVYAHINVALGKEYGFMYVGQTRNRPTARWSNGHGYKECGRFWAAIQKYGWESFAHLILAEGLTKEQADEMEKSYIASMKTNDARFGYNVSRGGSCIGEHYGVQVKVALFACDGELINTFDSIAECAHYIGVASSSLSSHLAKPYGTVGGYICRKFVNGEIPELSPDEKRAPRDMRSKFKPVNIYTLDGKFIRTCQSVKDAARFIGTTSSTVSSALARCRHSTHGYHIRYASECESGDVSPVRKIGDLNRGGLHYAARAIIRYDCQTCDEVRRYGSISEAVRDVGCGSNTLLSVIDAPNRTCAGSIWRSVGSDVPVAPLSPRTSPSDNPHRVKRAVWKCDPITRERLERFDSASAASKAMNCSSASITYACRGRTKIALGFAWEYDN